MKLTKSRKIMSIDGSALYKANYIENRTFDSKAKGNNLYKGVLNPSLELIRLKELIRDKDTDTEEEENRKLKQIVKVTFKKCVKSYDNTKISINKIKDKLYEDGFTIDGKKYVLYKRSSSASRNAIVLFIRDNIFGSMRSWSWLGKEELKADKLYSNMAGFKAYESLSLSTIIDTININPKHILLVNDYESVFKQKAMVISKNGDTLRADKKEYTYHSSIFDGEGLIQKELIEGKSFALLRARWLKSCAFACDIQQFFKDNNITTVKDMFGREMKADEVELIITPSSLKWLKTSKELFNGDDKECYEYWINHVGSLFGIVKDGHKSKYGDYQRLTYQQLNAVNLTTEQLTKMLEGEINYISNIKNDIRYFKQHISKNDNSVTRKALYNLLNVNTNIQHTELFKKFKDRTINTQYINTLKKGKIKVKGCDYYTVCGNPVELLYQAINKFKGEVKALKDNEIYCKRFTDNKELAVIRNPCINQGNTFYAVNKHNELLDKYMVLDGNIVIVNAINSDIDMRCAGMDRDSDEILIHSNPYIVEQVKKNTKYLTPVTDIKADNKLRYWTNADMCEVDKLISENYIGKIVNLSQQLNSMYWHEDNKSNSDELKLEKLYELTSILSIASMLEIDKAKKLLDINMKKLLKDIKRNPYVYKLRKQDGKLSNTPVNPMFFISTGHKRNRCKYMECTMDRLYSILSDSNVIKKADGSSTIPLKELLKDIKIGGKANYNQIPKLLEYIADYSKKMNNKRLELAKCDNDFKRTQINEDIKELNDNITKRLLGLKLQTETIYSLLLNIEDKYSKIKLDLLAVLYRVAPDKVIECFKENPPKNESLIENEDGDIEIWGIKYKTI